jgi:D-serine ammonia-lyase
MPLSILTEITSLYSGRGGNGKTEALIAAGQSAFGPESDLSMGWGTVGPAMPPFDQGWYVQRAKKESAVLVCKGVEEVGLKAGQRVKIYPYDSAGASERFGWYFVVDSSRIDHGDEIVDIFVRWRN